MKESSGYTHASCHEIWHICQHIWSMWHSYGYFKLWWFYIISSFVLWFYAFSCSLKNIQPSPPLSTNYCYDNHCLSTCNNLDLESSTTVLMFFEEHSTTNFRNHHPKSLRSWTKISNTTNCGTKNLTKKIESYQISP